MLHARLPIGMQETPQSTTYETLFPLEKGGMGQVELAIHKDGRFSRLHAIKRLLPEMRNDDTARTMFLEEARLAGLLHHPNVVGVSDVGEDSAGPYLVMEYVEGITVDAIIKHSRKMEVPLPIPLCFGIISQVSRGLAEAHGLRGMNGKLLGLVHRDVSPQNIIVGYDGVVRLMDFGIARAAGREHVTSTGVLKGKLGYMAPELLHFEEPGAQADLFALGVVFYELLASERLYADKNHSQRCQRILHEPPPDIEDIRSDVPPEVQAILFSMLAKRAEHRPKSATTIHKVLQASLQNLVEEEGVYDISAYIGENFETKRAVQKERVSAAIAQLEATSDRTTSSSNSKEENPPSKSKKWVGLALAIVAIAIAFTVWWSRTKPDASDEPTGAEVASQIEKAITIQIESEPVGAIVEGDQLSPTPTPTTVLLPRSQDPVQLRFSADGHEPHVEEVIPAADLQVHVRLVKKVASTESKAKPRMRRRRRNKVKMTKEKASFELFTD